MKRTGRVGIVLLAVLLCFCLGAFVVFSVASGAILERMVSNNPETARNVGESILDYTIPRGYEEAGSLDILGLEVVYIRPQGAAPGIVQGNEYMLIQLPEALQAYLQEVRQSVILSFMGASDEISTMGTVEVQKRVVRGEEVSFEVQETFGQYDTAYRMMFSEAIDGKSGKAIIIIAGPIDSWDQGAVEQFIQSIQ